MTNPPFLGAQLKKRDQQNNIDNNDVQLLCTLVQYIKRFSRMRLNFSKHFIPRAGGRNFFSYDIFVHGSKFQFIDGINLNLTHVCVCCEIIFVFTYIALVVFVYKVKKKKNSIKILPKMPRMGFEPTPCEWRAHRIVHSATA